jgi:hypothetical protein
VVYILLLRVGGRQCLVTIFERVRQGRSLLLVECGDFEGNTDVTMNTAEVQI